MNIDKELLNRTIDNLDRFNIGVKLKILFSKDDNIYDYEIAKRNNVFYLQDINLDYCWYEVGYSETIEQFRRNLLDFVIDGYIREIMFIS